MVYKITNKAIESYIRFGIEIWLCLEEQYPEVMKSGEMVTIKEIE